MFAKNLLDRHRLGAVVELSRAGMRVDVVDLLGCELRVGQRMSHRANTRFTIRQWRRHVKSIIIQTITEHFRINFRSAGSRMFEFFYDERCRALAHDKAIAQSVKWARSKAWIVASAHCFNNVERSDG